MSENAQAVLSAVAKLSEEERAQVADAILLTLNAQGEEGSRGQAWLAEVQRRADEMEEGRIEAIPWEDVRAEGQALLDAND